MTRQPLSVTLKKVQEARYVTVGQFLDLCLAWTPIVNFSSDQDVCDHSVLPSTLQSWAKKWSLARLHEFSALLCLALA